MGIHLYINNISDDSEVEIPYFLWMPNLETIKFETKEELKAVLTYCKFVGINQLSIVQFYTDSLQQIKTNGILNSPYQESNLNDVLGWIMNEYHWKNNVGYNDKIKEFGVIDGTISMLLWEKERITKFMWSEEKIDTILNIFKEGIHYASTR